jgi:hypothetical protein
LGCLIAIKRRELKKKDNQGAQVVGSHEVLVVFADNIGQKSGHRHEWIQTGRALRFSRTLHHHKSTVAEEKGTPKEPLNGPHVKHFWRYRLKISNINGPTCYKKMTQSDATSGNAAVGC